jgi:hypothetical protein
MLKLRWGLEALQLLLTFVEEPIYAHICWGFDALNGTTCICISRSFTMTKDVKSCIVKLSHIVESSVESIEMFVYDDVDYDSYDDVDYELIMT